MTVGVLRTAAVIALAIAGASCGADDAEPATTTSPTASPSRTSPTSTAAPSAARSKPAKSTARGTTITTAGSEYGEILWGPKRQVVYIWQSEPSSKPQCYGDCATLWPPVLTTGTPRAAGGVDASLLGTTKRSDGSNQVTYNGHPLYYYAHEGPGEVECHDIATHGGLWWVVTPAGDRVT